MLALADILHEAGVPAGVVNIVVTSTAGEVTEPLIRSGIARKLSFTGSTPVGRKPLEQCAEKVLRTSMELGGNAALVVFEDADLDRAVEGAMLAKMRNSGRPARPPTASSSTPASSRSSRRSLPRRWVR